MRPAGFNGRALALAALCLALPDLSGAAWSAGPVTLECLVLRWDYNYAPASGASVHEETVTETLSLNLEEGTYAHMDEAGNRGEVRDIHSVTDAVIVLEDYGRAPEGVERDEYSARIDMRDWSYTYVRDIRRADGLEAITTGDGNCQPKTPLPTE